MAQVFRSKEVLSLNFHSGLSTFVSGWVTLQKGEAPVHKPELFLARVPRSVWNSHLSTYSGHTKPSGCPRCGVEERRPRSSEDLRISQPAWPSRCHGGAGPRGRGRSQRDPVGSRARVLPSADRAPPSSRTKTPPPPPAGTASPPPPAGTPSYRDCGTHSPQVTEPRCSRGRPSGISRSLAVASSVSTTLAWPPASESTRPSWWPTPRTSTAPRQGRSPPRRWSLGPAWVSRVARKLGRVWWVPLGPGWML